ncbi:MAG: hypothetical protein C0482_00980 [Gordonia sp.]|nr:hypothetical protein [Gordonia sp. (in: high G+C Gram-positive bacteria)]
MVPSWEELIDLNRATAGRPIQAVVHFAGNAAMGWTSQRVWFAPPNWWRVEDLDGTVQRVNNNEFAYRRVGSSLHRYRTSEWTPGGPVNARLQPPSELLVAHRRWPAPKPPAPDPTPPEASPTGVRVGRARLITMTGSSHHDADTRHFEPTGPAEAVIVRGRPGWTVPCVMPSVAQHPVRVTLTFDAETGVVIGRNAGRPYDTVEVSDLVVDDPIDPTVFEWDGEYVDAEALEEQRQAEIDAHQAVLEQIPTLIPTTWPRPGLQTFLEKGHPDTWALHLMLFDSTGFDGALSRWPLGSRRPFLVGSRHSHTNSWSDDYWTYAIDTEQPLTDAEARQIQRSVPTVIPPATMQDEARRAAAAMTAAAVIDAEQILYAGSVNVHYGFFTLTAFPDAPVPGVDAEPFAGQSNGLCGTAAEPLAHVRTGLHTGAVNVEVILSPIRPPVDSARWEEIVELDYHVDTPTTMLAGFSGGTALAIPLGHYRMRFSARHMDQAHQADTGNHIDTYQLLLWPSGPSQQAHQPTDTILKATSSIAKARHSRPN